MSRSSKKGAFVDQSLMKKVLAAKEANSKKPIKT
jgi:ribosomal protein S19